MENNFYNAMGDKEAREVTEVPKKVKSSQFGCRNCLWASIECKSGSMYQPKSDGECNGYTYYD